MIFKENIMACMVIGYGIKFIDEMHLGLKQENLPDVLDNKEETYYFLPFILGLIGFFFCNRNKNLFWVMLVFFLFTGIAIQVYTNVRPLNQEKETTLLWVHFTFLRYG